VLKFISDPWKESSCAQGKIQELKAKIDMVK